MAAKGLSSLTEELVHRAVKTFQRSAVHGK